jgi:CRISPR-associated protein Csh1
MINEICQFVETLESDAPQIFEESGDPEEGIYVVLDIRHDNGNFYLHNIDDTTGNLRQKDICLYKKKTEMNPFFERCSQILKYSRPVSSAKIFNPNKKIFNMTCSPYVIGFSKKILDKNRKTIGESDVLNKELIGQYFKRAEEFVEDGNSRIWFEAFKNYLSNHFWVLLKQINYDGLKDSDKIIIMLKEPTIEDYKIPYQKYLGKNVFNKAEYNIVHHSITYGISDSLSSFNGKKPFLQHQSASFKYNYRISGDKAQSIWKFYQLIQNKQLPNPLPIFVDKNETDLNTDVVKLFKTEGVTTNYTDIIRSLLKKRKSNLQNFYLLFIRKGQIIDLDFVPLFKYKLMDQNKEDFTIKNLFDEKTKEYFNKDNDIFDFQENIVNCIFNGQLIQKTKIGSTWLKYFDDLEIKPEYGLTDAIYNLLQKYRYSWYCYIYKSMHQAITMTMINEMCLESIIDDIRHDEELNKTGQIRKKISIWFGIQPIFDKYFKINDMANKTKQLQERIREIAKNESFHIETDDEFAFSAGQVIWKLLIQNESANRTHALLEPFLQKTEPVLFKQSIANTFNMYKHKFVLYPTKYEFDKLFSEVMGYIPENNKMKEHLPMILAGYFSETAFKKENN